MKFGDMEPITGADGRYISEKLVPEWHEHFMRKAKDYNDNDGFEPHRVLGIRGQFAEVWRKVWKLKNALWDGRTLTAEPPREVLLDMIGHCFLAIAMMDTEAPPPGRLGEVPQASEEPWQGRTKLRSLNPGEGLPVEDLLVRIKRPNDEYVEIMQSQASRVWPICGRERCINCHKVTLREFLESSNDVIRYGQPAPGAISTDDDGVAHYDMKVNDVLDEETRRRNRGYSG